MAFKKGISGNPGGKSVHKVFTDALRVVVNREDGPHRKKKIMQLAETLVDCALKDREGWAFQQIADRLEGKPRQVVETTDDRTDIDEFSDAELTAILRQHIKVVPVESDEQRPDDETLN
jgi:hypothetical protein